MCIGPEINFYIDDTPLENVSRFKYLGSFISRLKHCVFNNHDLAIETKIKVYKQNLLLVLMYESETWTLYAHEIRQLRTFQQRHLRAILKIRWDDFISNEDQ